MGCGTGETRTLRVTGMTSNGYKKLRVTGIIHE